MSTLTQKEASHMLCNAFAGLSTLALIPYELINIIIMFYVNEYTFEWDEDKTPTIINLILSNNKTATTDEIVKVIGIHY